MLQRTCVRATKLAGTLYDTRGHIALRDSEGVIVVAVLPLFVSAMAKQWVAPRSRLSELLHSREDTAVASTAPSAKTDETCLPAHLEALQVAIPPVSPPET